MRYSPVDSGWRDYTAAQLLGTVLAKTAGTRLSNSRRLYDGWLYVGPDALVFIRNDEGQGGTNADRVLHYHYSDLGPSKITAPWIAPNGIVTFASGMELQGRKRQMKVLATAAIKAQ